MSACWSTTSNERRQRVSEKWANAEIARLADHFIFVPLLWDRRALFLPVPSTALFMNRVVLITSQLMLGTASMIDFTSWSSRSETRGSVVDDDNSIKGKQDCCLWYLPLSCRSRNGKQMPSTCIHDVEVTPSQTCADEVQLSRRAL